MKEEYVAKLHNDYILTKKQQSEMLEAAKQFKLIVDQKTPEKKMK